MGELMLAMPAISSTTKNTCISPLRSSGATSAALSASAVASERLAALARRGIAQSAASFAFSHAIHCSNPSPVFAESSIHSRW